MHEIFGKSEPFFFLSILSRDQELLKISVSSTLFKIVQTLTNTSRKVVLIKNCGSVEIGNASEGYTCNSLISYNYF
jgi:hypothetical protein